MEELDKFDPNSSLLLAESKPLKQQNADISFYSQLCGYEDEEPSQTHNNSSF